MKDPTPLESLRSSRLGPDLDEEQLRALAPLLTFRELRDGETLVAEGTSDNHLYVLLSGTLAVTRNAGKAEELTLFTLGAGDLVASSRSSTARRTMPRSSPGARRGSSGWSARS